MRNYLKQSHRIIEAVSYVLLLIAGIITLTLMVLKKQEVTDEAFMPLIFLAVNAAMSLSMRFLNERCINLPFRVNERNAFAVYTDSCLMLVLTMLVLAVYGLVTAVTLVFTVSEAVLAKEGMCLAIALSAVLIVMMVKAWKDNQE